MNQNHQDHIQDGLGNLPKYRASPEFTDRAIRALEVRSARPLYRRPAMGWLLATAVALALGVWMGTYLRQQNIARSAYKQKLYALRAEYQQIQSEVDSLRKDASDSPAVVYLGGNEQIDLVLDLADLEAYTTSSIFGQIRPANYQP